MKLLRNLLTVTAMGAVALLSLTGSSHADIVVVDGDTVKIESYGWNTNGVAFDAPNEGNVTGELINGAVPGGGNVAGHPITVTSTYNNLALDNDAVADDSVTFTMQVTSPAGPGLLFNQGFHTNWGTLEGLVVTVSSVSGTTSAGSTIVFDGFTGAAIGAGNGAAIDRTIDVNGVTSSLVSPDMGSFQFIQDFQDFAPVSTLNYTNSGGTVGTLVARNFDLQFSAVPATIPEPSSMALLGLAGLGLATRRRR